MAADASAHAHHNPFDLAHGHAETDFQSLLNDPDDVNDGEREMDMFVVVRPHGEDGDEELGVSAPERGAGPAANTLATRDGDGDQEMSGIEEALAVVGSAALADDEAVPPVLQQPPFPASDEGQLMKPLEKNVGGRNDEAKEENLFDFVRDAG
jgi:hypothetical protein